MIFGGFGVLDVCRRRAPMSASYDYVEINLSDQQRVSNPRLSSVSDSENDNKVSDVYMILF